MRAGVAIASCLLFSCAGNESPVVGPKPPLEAIAEPGSLGRSFQVGQYVSLSAPDKHGASIALIGGRRARLHADGRVEVESVAAPEPLIGIVEVPSRAGSMWLGASRHGVFRFADPLAGGTLIHRSPEPIVHIAAVPGAIAMRIQGGDRWSALDAESGKLLPDVSLGGAIPARSIAFDSPLHGLATAGSYKFETRDAGASWRFRWSPQHDLEAVYGAVIEPRDWDRNRALFKQLESAPLTARFMVESGEDPLVAAAARGVLAPDDTAIVGGRDGFRLARVSLSTGAVLAATAMDVRGECVPFATARDAVGVACDNGSVYPLEISAHSLVVGRGTASGSSGKPIVSVGGGIAYNKGCNSTADDGSLCVRQVNGSFASIPLPPSTLGKSIRPNGSVLVARREKDEIVIERHSHWAAPEHLGEWRACPDARSVDIDELEGGFRLVGPVACTDKRPQYGMFTKLAGAGTTQPLDDALSYRMGGGHIMAISTHEVRLMSHPGAGWQHAPIREGQDARLSEVGFLAGDIAHLGWEGRFDGFSEQAPPPPQAAQLPKLVCKSGAVIAKGKGLLYQPPFRGTFFPRHFETMDTFIGLTTVKGNWRIQWLDMWELGGAVHELKLKAPGKGEAYVSSVAVRGESIVATVAARGPDFKEQAWVLRHMAGGAVERESTSLGARDMVLSPDGTAAWVTQGRGVVWPAGKPTFDFFFPAADDLTLAADGGRAYLFAPHETLETVVEVKGALPGPTDDGFDASLFAAAVPRWRDQARSLAACGAANAGGHLVRITLPAGVDIDGASSPESTLAADVSWQPGQPPCIARMRAYASPQMAAVGFDLATNRAELVDLVRGEGKELACHWENDGSKK